MGAKKVNFFILSFLIIGLFKCTGQKIDKEHITIEQIDSIRINEIQKKTKKGLFREALELDFMLLDASRKLDYKKGVTCSLLNIARVLCTLAEFREAFQYINLVENSEYYKSCKCQKLRAKVSNEKGRILIALGYNNFAIEELNKGLRVVKDNPALNKMAGSLNINKAAAFSAKNEVDSTIYSLQLAVKYKPITFTYAVMSRAHLLFEKDLDSAKYYIDLAETKLNKSTRYQESIYLRCKAFYYEHINNLEEAVSYYQESLEISLAINRNKEVLKTYRNLAQINNSLGEIEKSNRYFHEFTKLNDSINRYKNEIRDLAAKEYITQKEQTYKDKKNQWLVISISLGFFVIGGGFFSRKYMKTKYKKKVQEKSEELQKINSLVEKSELEQEALKTKLDKTALELIESAKNNDESFVPGFKELYPELNNKLLEINPKLTKSDFSLLGMIWINFSSKDIARYTFVQHKTVQTKKYRLRKKLNLPQGADLYNWLRDLNSGI